MRDRFTLIWLCVLMGLGCAIAQAADPRNAERVWTDQQGRKVTAKLLRVEGDVIYLDLGNRVSQMPFDQLSDAVQRFLAAPDEKQPAAGTRTPAGTAAQPPLAEPRVWTINNRQVQASFAGADEEAVYLATPTGNIRLSFDAILSDSDAADIDSRLRPTRPDLADRVIRAYEQNTGAKFGASVVKPSPPAASGAPTPSPVEITGELPQATDPNDVPENEVVPREIVTADKAFAAAAAKPATADPKTDELASFRNRAILGGFALVAIVAAVLGFSWFTTKRKEEQPH